MCHFITLITSGLTDQRVSEVARAHGRRAAPLGNPSLRSVLSLEERQYITTTAHCDCGTVLAKGAEASAPSDDEAAIEALRRKRWSDAKIARWRENRVRSAENASRRVRPNAPDTAELWAALIDDVLAEPSAEKAGLFLRFYRGDIETERFNAARREAPLKQLGGILEDFPEDTAVVFTA